MKSGYGMLGRKLAHRIAYEGSYGEIPPGLCILHSCDNPACVNPAHLRTGTQAENMADMDAKGRRASLKGDDAPKAKLTSKQIVAIRRAFVAGETRADLSRRYDVSYHAIDDAVSMTTWSHIKDGPTRAQLQSALKRDKKCTIGERNNNAKLTAGDVRDIRKRLSDGQRGSDIARLYKVSKYCISAIKCRRAWAHIDD